MSCRITLAAIALAGIAGSVQSQSCDFIDDPDTNTYSGMFGEIQNEIKEGENEAGGAARTAEHSGRQ